MPFWTKGRLYGAASPVIVSRSVPRTIAASSWPVISTPPRKYVSSRCRVSKWTSSYVSSSWFCSAWTSELWSMPAAIAELSISRRNSVSPVAIAYCAAGLVMKS